MNTRSKMGFIVNYILRTKPGLFLMGGVILLASGYFTDNGNITNVGWAFIIFAIIAGIILEVQTWSWKKVDKRHDGALSSSGRFHRVMALSA